MFNELFVENLALIESACLKWDWGLNVLTGETGAGKSMVIDAVSLLLGGRGSQDYIRAGADSCTVQGNFSPPYNNAIAQKLEELGFMSDDDLFLVRELNRNGKSVCRINFRQVPLAVFKDLGRMLINIHGQMEHMSLLESENQRILLDSFGDNQHKAALEKVAVAYEKWQSKADELKAVLKLESNADDRLQLLNFQIREIEEANLSSGEEEQLLAERDVLASFQILSDSAKAAYQALSAGENPPLAGISRAVNALEAIKEIDKVPAAALERLNDVYYNLEDIILDLRNYRETIVDNPERLDEIETRLQQIKVLSKKYGGDVDYILEILADNQKEVENIANHDDLKTNLASEAEKLKQDYLKLADILHDLRKKSGEKLAAAITTELKYLQMSQAIFGVDLLPDNHSRFGYDAVEFMINPNPGEGFKPVAKIASGGEMARIMLSIKVILARLDSIPTLIFDEIDTGLGGVALVSVAEKLTEISGNTQAICVTHAPVIAAYADNNLLVSKSMEGTRTITHVDILEDTAKLQEIARMLAGQNVSETTYKQARELMEQGNHLKIKK